MFMHIYVNSMMNLLSNPIFQNEYSADWIPDMKKLWKKQYYIDID